MSKRVLGLAVVTILFISLSVAAQEPGTRKWYYGLGEPGTAAMGSDGTLYVGTRTSSVHAINPDGTRKWARSFGCTGRYSEPVVGPDDTIYASCDWYTRQLHAINPDGTIKWSKNFNAWGPVIGADGTLYVGYYSSGHLMHAFDPDGRSKWRFRVPGESHPAAIAADGTIYLTDSDSTTGRLFAVYPDGKERWRIDIGARSTSAPSIGADGTVYVGVEDGKLYAVNPDGTVEWIFQAPAAFYATPAIGEDGTIYAGCHDHSLYAINPDGSQKWTFPTYDYILTTPAIGADGTIYLAGDDGELYALTPEGGVRWSTTISLWWNRSSPLIGPDGILYVGGNSGGSQDHFRAFYTDSGGLASSPWPMYRQNPNLTSRRQPLDQPPEELWIDDPVEVELPPGEVNRYLIETDRDRNLLIEVIPGDGVDGLAVDAEFEQVEYPGGGEYSTMTPTEHGTYELLISPTAEGLYMVTVLGTRVAVNGGSYTLSASYLENHLSDLLPTGGGNAGDVSITVRGLGFIPGMQVELAGPGLSSLSAREIAVGSSNILTARFDLVGVSIGLYDLVVTWPGGAQLALPESFTVVPGIGPRLEVNLEVPGAVRAGRTYTARLEYANTGDADMPAPLLSVRSNAFMSLDPESIDRNRVDVLAIGETETPEILRVGESWHVPIYFRATGGDPVFEVLEAQDDTAAINWITQKEIMKPEGMSPTEWDALWPDLVARLGTTWAEYLEVLRGNASRFARRGQLTHDVQGLIQFETRQARGLPAAAIAGTLRDGRTYRPLPNTMVRAISIDESVVREVMTADSPAGHFVFDNLPSGIYELYVEGSFFDPTPVVDVIADDVVGLMVDAHEYPVQPEPEEIGTPRRDPSVTQSESGELFMVWAEADQIWWARNTAGSWESWGAIPDAIGQNPVVILDPYLLDGETSPGIVVAWESSEDATVIKWVAGRPMDDGVDWSLPQQMTSDGFDDFNVALTEDPLGPPMALWLQRDVVIRDDTDLYFDNFDLNGVETLSTANVFESEGSAEKTWEACVGVPDFGFSKSLPKWIPIIGGNYEFDFTGEVCGSGDCDASLEGIAELKVEFSDVVNGVAELSADADWTTDRQACDYVFQSGKVSGEAGFELNVLARVPIPFVGFGPAKAKIGVVGEATVGGSLIWKGSFLSWPHSGEITPSVAAGVKGVVELLGEGLVGEVKGTVGMTSVFRPPSSYTFKGYCAKLEGELEIGWGLWKLKWKKDWGNACSKSMLGLEGISVLESNNKRFTLFESYVAESVQVTEVFEYEKSPLIGTGATYEGMPVLGDISSDLLNDGAPAVATNSTGEIVVVWTKDVEATLMGGEVVVASLDGSAWSTPLAVTTEVNFVKTPAAVFDSDDNLIVVWSSASNDGLDYQTSMVEEIIDASADADIVFAVRSEGFWSVPATLTELVGTDESPGLAAGPAGEIVVAWVNRGIEDSVVMVSTWDGTSWSVPVVVSSGVGIDPPVVAYDSAGPVILWAQDVDGNMDTFDDWVLMESRWDGADWSPPTEPIPQPLEVKSCRADHSVVLEAAKAEVVGTPPPHCCDEEEEPPIPPETPGQTRDETTSDLIVSRDPNEKVAPTGTGELHRVEAGTELAYEVHFENLATATAPAQEVFVSDCLDRNLDWTTFRLHDVIFGDSAAANRSSRATFVERVTIPDYRSGEDKTWWVDVESTFDLSTGCFEMTLRQLDPDTGDLPLDPYAGILPPEDGTGRGQGHLSFSVNVKDDIEDGRVVTNRAKIVFDYNEPIWTNEVFNTIGGPPEYLLTVTTAGDGVGSVTSTPEGIDCGGVCEARFVEDTVVELSQFAEDGSQFVEWGGNADCLDGVLTMVADFACTATFILAANEPPVADAGPDQVLEADAQCEALVTLDGTASYDPDEAPLVFLWQSVFGEGNESIFETTVPIGEHEFTLTVTDDFDESATDTTMVTVEDVTDPTITLNGEVDMTLECKQPYTEPGATVEDNCEGELEALVGGDMVSSEAPAEFIVTYDAADSAGNSAAQLTRTVSVVDTEGPTIALNGEADMTLECKQPYSEPGATAEDACEGDLEVMIGGDTVSSETPAVFSITYDAADSLGNQAEQVTRTVSVVDNQGPNIDCGLWELFRFRGRRPGAMFFARFSANDACTEVASSQAYVSCGDVSIPVHRAQFIAYRPHEQCRIGSFWGMVTVMGPFMEFSATATDSEGNMNSCSAAATDAGW